VAWSLPSASATVLIPNTAARAEARSVVFIVPPNVESGKVLDRVAVLQLQGCICKLCACNFFVWFVCDLRKGYRLSALVGRLSGGLRMPFSGRFCNSFATVRLQGNGAIGRK